METSQAQIFIFGIFVILFHLLPIPVFSYGYVKAGFLALFSSLFLDVILYVLVKPGLKERLLLKAEKNRDFLIVALFGSLAFIFHGLALFILYQKRILNGFLCCNVALLYDALLFTLIDKNDAKTVQKWLKNYSGEVILTLGFGALASTLSIIPSLYYRGIEAGILVGKMSIILDGILYLIIKEDNEINR